MRGICKKEIGAISELGAEKITFPPKSDRRTDGRTDGRTDIQTDISNYRVASLLKRIRILRVIEQQQLY